MTKLVTWVLGLILLTACTLPNVSLVQQPSPSPSPNATWDAWWHEYDNRTKYTELSGEIIATIEDRWLDLAVQDFISYKIGANYTDTERILGSLGPGFEAAYYVTELEGEVNNGGYSQYFFNPSGTYVTKALEGLKLIGATAYVANLEKAIAIHIREESDPTLRKLYDAKTLEEFSESYKYTKLGECDDEFYALDTGDNRLETLRLKFIRQHPELFTAK